MAWEPKDSSYNDSFIYQNPFNSGIGDWYGNMDKWKSMQTGQQLTPEQVSFLQDANKNGVPTTVYGEEDQNYKNILQTMGGYLYRGDDGKNYMINGSSYKNAPGDPETAASSRYDALFGGPLADGAGRKPGEMSYSTTEFRPDWGGDLGAYNGSLVDNYDSQGKYVGGSVPANIGDKEWDRWQLTVLASMAAAGIGAYAAPAATGGSAATTGATLGEGALAASGNYGVAAGTAGAAGTNAAAAGAAGYGTAGVTGSNGAFLGEGVESGIGAWDGAAGGAAGGYGTIPLQGVGAPTASGAGAPASSSSGGLFGSGGGSSGGMFSGSVNIPGLGSVATSDIMKFALPLLGALGGSEGQEQTTTSTKELPEWLKGPVYGNGGVVPQSQWLMNQQLTNPGMLNKGLLQTVDKKKAKQRKRGLL